MKFKLCIEVEYTGKPTKKGEAAITQTLESAASFLAGNGLLTEGTGREVVEWGATVEKLGK